MERIKVSLPAFFSFTTTLAVRITDLNYGGHVGNDVFLSLAHEARQQFLQHHGYSELYFAGAGLIMTDAAIEYKDEIVYGNLVKISVAAVNFDRVGFDFFYKVEVQSDAGWRLAAKIKTGMTCFDYANKKRVAVPAEAVAKLSAQ